MKWDMIITWKCVSNTFNERQPDELLSSTCYLFLWLQQSNPGPSWETACLPLFVGSERQNGKQGGLRLHANHFVVHPSPTPTHWETIRLKFKFWAPSSGEAAYNFTRRGYYFNHWLEKSANAAVFLIKFILIRDNQQKAYRQILGVITTTVM